MLGIAPWPLLAQEKAVSIRLSQVVTLWEELAGELGHVAQCLV